MSDEIKLLHRETLPALNPGSGAPRGSGLRSEDEREDLLAHLAVTLPVDGAALDLSILHMSLAERVMLEMEMTERNGRAFSADYNPLAY